MFSAYALHFVSLLATATQAAEKARLYRHGEAFQCLVQKVGQCDINVC
jgi:hypothetical protein